MNCHKDNKVVHVKHKHSPLKHLFHMVICCGLPIIILSSLPVITRVSPNAGSAISKIVPFICPIMMILMIPMMMGNNKKGTCCDHTTENHDNNKPHEINNIVE